MTVLGGGEIRINNDPPRAGVLTVEVEAIEVTTLTKPDPSWSTVDRAGHFHATAPVQERGLRRVEYPTLDVRSVHHDCAGCEDDEECEGYDVSEYACRICGETVSPGVLANMFREMAPGRTYWSVEVSGGADLMAYQGETVTVRATAGGRTHLGIAHGSYVNAEGGSDGIRARLTLVGAGPIQQIGAETT